MIAALLLFASVGTQASPITEPSTWITTNDYPKSEISRGASGTTAVTLMIDSEGVPVDCNATLSSSSVVLDATACALLKARARFNPARDGKGAKVGFVYNTRVLWKFPGWDSLVIPSKDQIISIVVDFNEKGIVEACTPNETAISEGQTNICARFPVGLKSRVYTDASGKPIKVKMTMAQTISFVAR